MSDSEWVSRREFDHLVARVEQMDSLGTRGVGAMSVQITELAKDFSDLKADTKAWEATHDKQHEQEKRERTLARRWLVGAAIAAVAAVDGPVVTVLLARGGR